MLFSNPLCVIEIKFLQELSGICTLVEVRIFRERFLSIKQAFITVNGKIKAALLLFLKFCGVKSGKKSIPSLLPYLAAFFINNLLERNNINENPSAILFDRVLGNLQRIPSACTMAEH
jgi:hypothetical protein